MDLKPHPEGGNRAVLTIDSYDELFLLQRVCFPAGIHSPLSRRLNTLEKQFPKEMPLTNRQLSFLGERLLTHPITRELGATVLRDMMVDTVKSHFDENPWLRKIA